MLKVLLIILLIILVVRFFNRLSFSTYVYTGDRNPRDSAQKKREGTVTVENNDRTEKIVSKDEGEYIDYEEVK